MAKREALGSGLEELFGEKMLRELERVVMLKIVDERWMDHIDAMDELKDGIGLRAYGQKDPVVQYRIEGFDMFDQMVADIQLNVVKILMNARKREGTPTRQESVKITGEGLEETNVSLKGNTPTGEKNHTGKTEARRPASLRPGSCRTV